MPSNWIVKEYFWLEDEAAKLGMTIEDLEDYAAELVAESARKARVTPSGIEE